MIDIDYFEALQDNSLPKRENSPRYNKYLIILKK